MIAILVIMLAWFLWRQRHVIKVDPRCTFEVWFHGIGRGSFDWIGLVLCCNKICKWQYIEKEKTHITFNSVLQLTTPVPLLFYWRVFILALSLLSVWRLQHRFYIAAIWPWSRRSRSHILIIYISAGHTNSFHFLTKGVHVWHLESKGKVKCTFKGLQHVSSPHYFFSKISHILESKHLTQYPITLKV